MKTDEENRLSKIKAVRVAHSYPLKLGCPLLFVLQQFSRAALGVGTTCASA